MHQSHHARFANAGVNGVDTRHFQGLNDAGRGVNFFKAQLGVGMQVSPKGCQFRMKLGNVGKRAALCHGAF